MTKAYHRTGTRRIRLTDFVRLECANFVAGRCLRRPDGVCQVIGCSYFRNILLPLSERYKKYTHIRDLYEKVDRKNGLPAAAHAKSGLPAVAHAKAGHHPVYPGSEARKTAQAPRPALTRQAYLFTAMLLAVLILASAAHGESVRVTTPGRTGTASWYSRKSCRHEGTSGVVTASGERFDENALTAAMWDVPFGTRFLVVNSDNDKRVVVRINDRGPAKRLVRRGRIIDLSKGAFRRLAPLSQGVVKVSVFRIIESEK